MNEEKSTCCCSWEEKQRKEKSTFRYRDRKTPQELGDRPRPSMGVLWEKDHGFAKNKSSIYGIWRNMRYRCNNPRCKEYPRYGGRGIRVCDRWDDFMLFMKDMGPRPRGFSLGRKENNGDYCPENCRWESSIEQNNNTRFNRFYKGKTVAQWSRETGLSHACLLKRINRGLDVFAPLGISKWANRKRS